MLPVSNATTLNCQKCLTDTTFVSQSQHGSSCLKVPTTPQLGFSQMIKKTLLYFSISHSLCSTLSSSLPPFPPLFLTFFPPPFCCLFFPFFHFFILFSSFSSSFVFFYRFPFPFLHSLLPWLFLYSPFFILVLLTPPPPSHYLYSSLLFLLDHFILFGFFCLLCLFSTLFFFFDHTHRILTFRAFFVLNSHHHVSYCLTVSVMTNYQWAPITLLCFCHKGCNSAELHFSDESIPSGFLNRSWTEQ